MVANIPSDVFATIVKRKFIRIRESFRDAIVVNESLKVIRPFLLIRPEIAPSFVYGLLAKQFWNSVNKAYLVDQFDEIRLIIYNPHWAKILAGTMDKLKIGYYLFDEVRNEAFNDKINKKRFSDDLMACKVSSCIFTMTKDIADARKEFTDKITVVGNGAEVSYTTVHKKINNSVAFVGNFRNWIDFKLLDKIISNNQDYSFYFIGHIENNVYQEFESILTRYTNVYYGGCKDKEIISSVYSMFESIIIPYKQNQFIHATRPIKIVESVMAGVPVITVPISGYEPCSFIKFATNADEFTEAIHYYSTHRIDKNSQEYLDFVKINSWKAKADLISVLFDEV